MMVRCPVWSDRPCLQKVTRFCVSFFAFVGSRFPTDVAFHAHGLGLRGDRLFVVNHAEGEDRIDVFTLSRDASSGSVAMRFEWSHHGGKERLFAGSLMGALNGVCKLAHSFGVVLCGPQLSDTQCNLLSLLDLS